MFLYSKWIAPPYFDFTGVPSTPLKHILVGFQQNCEIPRFLCLVEGWQIADYFGFSACSTNGRWTCL